MVSLAATPDADLGGTIVDTAILWDVSRHERSFKNVGLVTCVEP